MNLSKYIVLGGLLVAGTVHAQLDRSVAPKPQPAKEIKIGKPDVFKLDNGLTVLVVENHKIPKVSFQLTSDIGAIKEGDKAGMVSIAGELMGSGTKNRSKDQLDEEVDFMGADLSTWSNGMYISGITSQVDKMAEIMSDVLLNPAFPESELARLKEQNISGLASSKGNPSAISANVSGAVNFGKDHPYGEIMSEKTIENISLDDIKKLYQGTFQPQISYMVVVGDIKTDAVKPIIEKYFSKWEKGGAVKATFNDVKMPHGNHVYFSPQEGAVQSTINVTFPVNLKPGQKDVLSTVVMNKILGGGGFGTRMMQNLREDKAFTYGCYSRLSPDELVGTFSTSGSFRNEVTDSALTEIISEIKGMTTAAVTDEELKLTKASMAGQFAMSLESPRTIARFALNTLKYDLPEDYYATYLKRLDAITKEDVLTAAKKYLRPDNANIVIVGNEDILKKLNKFDHHGKATKLDFYGNKISDMKPIPEGVTADMVLKNYVKAALQVNDDKAVLKKIKKIKTITQYAKGSIQGMTLDFVTYADKKGQEGMEIKMGPNVIQKTYFNGKEGGSSSMQGSTELTEEEVAEKLQKKGFFAEWFYTERGVQSKLIGIVDVNGSPAYKMAMGTDGKEFVYYDVATGFKVRTTSMTEIQGKEQSVSIEFKDYKEFEGMMFPSTMIQDMGMAKLPVKLDKLVVNGKIDKAVFNK